MPLTLHGEWLRPRLCDIVLFMRANTRSTDLGLDVADARNHFPSPFALQLIEGIVAERHLFTAHVSIIHWLRHHAGPRRQAGLLKKA